MKKLLFLSLCIVLALAACGEKPREPDERDIPAEDVAYIISSVGEGRVVIEDRELIEELTYSVNGLRSELGEYDEEVHYPSYGWPGEDGDIYYGSVTFYDRASEELARVEYYGDKVYRGQYYYYGQKTILFHRDKLKEIDTSMEGVSEVTMLYPELMWGAEKVWVEDAETGRTGVIDDKDGVDGMSDIFVPLYFRMDEACGEDEPYRFRLRWTYTEEDEPLESVDIGADGRIKRREHWCTPLNGPIDMEMLAGIAAGEK